MKINWERFPVGLLVLSGAFVATLAHGLKYITVPEGILGSIWTLATVVVYFYFRKSPNEEKHGR